MLVSNVPRYSSEELLERVQAVLGAVAESPVVYRGDPIVHVRSDRLYAAMEALKSDPDLDMAMLTSVTAVHWPEDEKEFELVYHLRSLSNDLFLVVKTRVAREEPAASLTPLYAGANWQEREVYDLFGVKFNGHPDLRRILMPEGYPWHPLRKGFPVEGPDFPIDAYQTDAHHKVVPDDFWGEQV